MNEEKEAYCLQEIALCACAFQGSMEACTPRDILKFWPSEMDSKAL